MDDDTLSSLIWFLKGSVSYYEGQTTFCKSINDKDGEMWNAAKADAYLQVLSVLEDCCS